MWAAFADAASHHALLVSGETVGCCSVNEARELLFFHVHAEYEELAEALLGYLIKRLELTAALPSTVDPSFLSLSLDAGHGSITKAMMFQHMLAPEGTGLSDLRPASAADHAAAMDFVESATSFPRAFLEPYLAERIEKGQLFLYEGEEEILASGECRGDPRQSGYAHLGVIVGPGQRGKGLGSRVIHELVLECRRRNVKPLCSTEPGNLAARRLIHKAGFRARHRVLRVALINEL
jgi:GNAT superfamily N-acetyltransferase